MCSGNFINCISGIWNESALSDSAKKFSFVLFLFLDNDNFDYKIFLSYFACSSKRYLKEHKPSDKYNGCLLYTSDISNAVSVNLQNYTKEGTYDIPVEVDLPDGVTLTKPVTVQLILTEKESTEDEQPENDAETN